MALRDAESKDALNKAMWEGVGKLGQSFGVLGSTARQGLSAQYDKVKAKVGQQIETARGHMNQPSPAVQLASQAYETAAATALSALRKVCSSLPVGGKRKKRNYTRRKY